MNTHAQVAGRQSRSLFQNDTNTPTEAVMIKTQPTPWRYDEESHSYIDAKGKELRMTGVVLPCGSVPKNDPCYGNMELIVQAVNDNAKLRGFVKEFIKVYGKRTVVTEEDIELFTKARELGE
jgi:hypothetical protein